QLVVLESSLNLDLVTNGELPDGDLPRVVILQDRLLPDLHHHATHREGTVGRVDGIDDAFHAMVILLSDDRQWLALDFNFPRLPLALLDHTLNLDRRAHLQVPELGRPVVGELD